MGFSLASPRAMLVTTFWIRGTSMILRYLNSSVSDGTTSSLYRACKIGVAIPHSLLYYTISESQDLQKRTLRPSSLKRKLTRTALSHDGQTGITFEMCSGALNSIICAGI